MIATVSLGLIAFVSQDQPIDIPVKELPKLALCVTCESTGVGHGEEKPVAGVRYLGKEYFFCNKKEVADFRKDPAAYMPPVLPRAMPAFALTDTTGKVWDVDSMKGRTFLLDFWATWCAPCKEMKPLLDKTRAEYKDRGFEILSVSIDEKKAAFDKFLTKTKFDNPVLWDSANAWATWNVRAVPTFFVVRNGQIVAQWVGKKKLPEIKAILEPWLTAK